MATAIWIGGAAAVAQIWTASIDSVDGTPANNTFSVTIGGVSISQVGDTDVATTAAALVALLNDSTHPYFSTITWTNPSAGNIVGTADTAGVPFIAALTETGAGTGSVTDFSESTANAGPNDWETAANWSTGAVPTSSDDVVFESNSEEVFWLPSSEQQINSLKIAHSYTGKIGLPAESFKTTDSASVSTAREYRTTYLKARTASAEIGNYSGVQQGSGSGRIKLDFGSTTACTILVYRTASLATESALQPVRIKASHASTTLAVFAGTVGVATDTAGETSQLSSISIEAGNMFVGDGVTLATLQQNGGTVLTENAPTTVNVDDGQLTMIGTGTVTNLNVAGTCDNTQSTLTITNCSIYRNAQYSTDYSRVTHSNPIKVQHCRLEDVSIDVGSHVAIAPSAA